MHSMARSRASRASDSLFARFIRVASLPPAVGLRGRGRDGTRTDADRQEAGSERPERKAVPGHPRRSEWPPHPEPALNARHATCCSALLLSACAAQTARNPWLTISAPPPGAWKHHWGPVDTSHLPMISKGPAQDLWTQTLEVIERIGTSNLARDRRGLWHEGCDRCRRTGQAQSADALLHPSTERRFAKS